MNTTHRLIIIQNPNSSHAARVNAEVLTPAKLLFQNPIEYAITQTSFETNVAKIAKILKPHDIIIAAGGDGTATIAANACLASKHTKTLKIGFLGFGNFNDIARTFSRRKTTIHDLIIHHRNTIPAYLLDISVNKKHFRHAVCYTTIGFLAGAANEFEDSTNRKKLQSGSTSFTKSLLAMFPYYRKNKGKKFLPPSSLSDKPLTDFLAINGPIMARHFRTRAQLYRTPYIHIHHLNVARFIATTPFIIRSLLGHMPGELKMSADLTLKTPSDLDIQTDGEYRLLKKAKSIHIKKSERPLNIIRPR